MKKEIRILRWTTSERAYECQIIRSDRKTTEFRIHPNGELELRIPGYCSWKEAELILNEKKDSLEKTIEQMRCKYQKAQEEKIHYNDGEKIPYYNKWLELEFVSRPPGVKQDWKQQIYVQHQDQKLLIYLPDFLRETEFVKYAVEAWYRENAKHVFEWRTAYWASRMDIQYEKIVIKEQKTRWGSCSSKGNLNFNWRLIQMPPDILDYVVIHELAHRKEMNHSPRFWRVVETFMPDYREKRQWLKENGYRFNGN